MDVYALEDRELQLRNFAAWLVSERSDSCSQAVSRFEESNRSERYFEHVNFLIVGRRRKIQYVVTGIPRISAEETRNVEAQY
jgi:hypothetical protein